MSNIDPAFQQELAAFQRRLDSMQTRSAKFLKALSEARLQADLEAIHSHASRRRWDFRVLDRLMGRDQSEELGGCVAEDHQIIDPSAADIVDPPYTIHK